MHSLSSWLLWQRIQVYSGLHTYRKKNMYKIIRNQSHKIEKQFEKRWCQTLEKLKPWDWPFAEKKINMKCASGCWIRCFLADDYFQIILRLHRSPADRPIRVFSASFSRRMGPNLRFFMFILLFAFFSLNRARKLSETKKKKKNLNQALLLKCFSTIHYYWLCCVLLFYRREIEMHFHYK